MGDRAVITTEESTIGIYLHWYGSREKIAPVLEYCRLSGATSPTEESRKGWSKLITVMVNAGLEPEIVNMPTDRQALNNYARGLDNGIYFIKDWSIVHRIYPFESLSHDVDIDELRLVNEGQPERDQLDDI